MYNLRKREIRLNSKQEQAGLLAQQEATGLKNKKEV